MKIIKPSYKIILQEPGIDGVYTAIEQAGRTCYKSVGTRYFKIPLCGTEVPNVWHQVRLDTTCNKITKIIGSGIGNDLAYGYISIANKDVQKFPDLVQYECNKEKYHQNITSKEFTDRMIKSGHLAMLEFGTVYLNIPVTAFVNSEPQPSQDKTIGKYLDNPHTRTVPNNKYAPEEYFITTNYRVLVENGWLDDLKYLCKPTEFHEKRICVRFTTDRGVSHELVRHKQLCVA